MAITLYALKPRFQGLLLPLAGRLDKALVFGVLGLYVGAGGTLPDIAVALMPALAILIGCNIVLRVRRGVAAATGARRR